MLPSKKILAPFDFSSGFRRAFVFSLFALNILAFVFIAAMNPVWTTNDTPRYISLADNLANGYFGLATTNGLEAEGVRAFGYPIFILMCGVLPGSAELNVVTVQVILHLTSIFFIWKLVKQNLGNDASIIFLILPLFYPFIAYQASVLSPEIPCLFLLSLATFVLDFSKEKNFACARFAAAGLTLALAMYFRSNLFPLPFFLTLLFLFFYRKNRKVQKAVLFLPLAAILTMLPAVVYNYQNFNKITPTPVYGGAQTSLWMATWHARLSTETILKYRRSEPASVAAASDMLEQMAEVNRKIGVNEKLFPINMGDYADNATRERVQREYGKSAVENIKETPGVYLKSSLINTFRMWFSAHLSNQGFSRMLGYYLLFTGFFIFLSGFSGIFSALRNPPHRANLFVVIAAAIMVFHSVTLCWTHTEARYTIPARLFLLVFAAYAVAEIFKKMRNCFVRLPIKN